MTEKHVLVLGAYGLIGAEVVSALRRAVHRVTGAGRNSRAAHRRLPGVEFLTLDMAQTTTPEAWHMLQGFDAVVNCAGALQDGPDTDLEALHHHALAALGTAACRSNTRIVQISAVGASPDSPIPFLASKARGDVALLASGAEATVLRPGLVLARSAYGGTTLIRMLASVPLIQPLALPEAKLQSVGTADICTAVLRAIETDDLLGQQLDLVETVPQSLPQIIAAHRHALGLSPARVTVSLPGWMIPITAKSADLLGRLGWRSPLRSTAIAVLKNAPVGDPAPWSRLASAVPTLEQRLEQVQLGPEHRAQARAALLMPLCVATLALFWGFSGVMGVLSLPAAMRTLLDIGWNAGLAKLSVLFWSAIDILLASAILYRPWAQKAALAMAGVSAIYLVMGTVVTPHLWADPLGPLAKIGPALMLALVTAHLLEER